MKEKARPVVTKGRDAMSDIANQTAPKLLRGKRTAV